MTWMYNTDISFRVCGFSAIKDFAWDAREVLARDYTRGANLLINFVCSHFEAML